MLRRLRLPLILGSQLALATIPACDKNHAPVARTSGDASVKVGARVVLDGSKSTDQDGDKLTYAWTLTLPSGSQAVLDDAHAVQPAFTADVAGQYRAELVVGDGHASSTAAATMTATRDNLPPKADAGADRAVKVATNVVLDGSKSSDSDGDPLAYQWSLMSKPSGSKAALAGATTLHPSFTPDLPGSYAVLLVVDDGTTTAGASVTVLASGPAVSWSAVIGMMP